MHKLALLRSHLLAAVPGLAAAPDRLCISIDNGALDWTAGSSLSHRLLAPVEITILDYCGPLDAITTPLCAWLAHYQPDLVAQAIKFSADLLSTQAWDIRFTIPLNERIAVTTDPATGAITTRHVIGEYPRTPSAVRHWELWSAGPADVAPVLAAAWDAP